MIKFKIITKSTNVYVCELFIALILLSMAFWCQGQEALSWQQATVGQPYDLNHVNLSNGDFYYNLPLLNAPSSEGGFPISINYHGGIKFNQTASSVGLGWGFSPGAITRQVVGYPDDYCEEIDWFNEIEPVGINGTVLIEEENYGFELTFAHSGYGLIQWSNNPYVDLSINTLISSLPVLGTIYDGIKAQEDRMNQASQLSSSVTRNINNNHSFDHSIKNNQHYLRTNIDNDSYIVPYGALYLGKRTGESHSMGQTDMDIAVDLSLKNPVRPIGLPHIAYDKYLVSAPGISGNIRPYLMENGSLAGVKGEYNDFDEPGSNGFANIGYTHDNPKESEAFFRYVGEPASNVQMNTGDLTFNGSYWQNDPPDVISNSTFYSSPVQNTSQGYYNFSNIKRLLSKRRVDWYIFEEVVDVVDNVYSSKGVVMNVDLFGGSQYLMHRNDPYNYHSSYRQIYAFKIIAEDGTTYHFGQPGFAYDEYMEIISIDDPDAKVKRHRKSAYAYTWLLTAITGPDYIDVNENGYTDHEDYGYWIRFDYDHYYDYANNDLDYSWRAPFETGEYYRDITNKNQYFSSGKMQLFYLNKITTRTHSAVFIYGERLDACDKNGKNPLLVGEIRVFENEVLESLETNGFTSTAYIHSSGLDKLYDFDDVYSVSETLYNSIISASIKSARLWFNYDLCKGAPDSEAPDQGKLTLKKLEIFGKQDEIISKPYVFDYAVDDINKNPNYSVDKYDRWGFYKSDGNGDDRYVTETSKVFTDAWSLRKITAPSGSQLEIVYESDDYIETGLGEIMVDIKSKNQFRFKENYSGFIRNDGRNMESYFSVGTQIPITFFVREWINDAVEINEEPKFPTIQSVNGDIIDFGTNLYNPEDFYYNNENDFRILVGYEVDFLPEYTHDGNIFGGGIRVKEIKYSEGNEIYKQVFQYERSDGKSSGITPTEPPSFNIHGDIFLDFIGDSDPTSEAVDGLGPGVQYSKVIVSNYGSDNELRSKAEYNFETYSKNTHLIREDNCIEWSDNTKYSNRIVTHNRLSHVGRPLSVLLYNNAGEIFRSNEYKYLDTQEIDDQGVIREVSHMVKKHFDRIYMGYPEDVWIDNYFIGWRIVVNEYITYPSILQQVITKSNGNKWTNTAESHDFFTGKVICEIIEDPNGNKYKKEVLQAYNAGLHDQMGFSVDATSHKNMLFQEAANFTYAWNENSQDYDKLLSATINPWSREWQYRYFDTENSHYDDINLEDCWRPRSSFKWTGKITDEGAYESNYVDWDWFAPTSINENNGWLKIDEISKYNHYSTPIEMNSVSNISAANKLGYDHQYVIATANNAKFAEFAYSGAEDELAPGNYFGGEVQCVSAEVITLDETMQPYIHTGTHSVKAEGNTCAFKYVYYFDQNSYNINKKYRASVWLHEENASNGRLMYAFFNDQGLYISEFVEVDANTFKAGQWYLLELDIPDVIENPQIASATAMKVEAKNPPNNQHVYFDDYRVHPVDASMQSYVYDEQTGQVTAILDNDNIATRYEYDDAGRLIKVYRETTDGFKAVTEHEYHYAGTSYLSFIPKYKNLGEIDLGSSSDCIDIILENEGNFATSGILSISGVHANNFSICNGVINYYLGPQASETIQIQFSPSAHGYRSAELKAIGNDSELKASSELTGRGLGPHLELDKGSYIFNANSSGYDQQTVTLTNVGEAATTGYLEIFNDSNNKFSFLPNGTSIDFNLEPGETKSVNVKFDPDEDTGYFTADIKAQSDVYPLCNIPQSKLEGVATPDE